MKKMPIVDLCYIGLFAAIIAVCAQIAVPMPFGVPMTLQTFAIPLAGVILGAKRGTAAALVYILLGLIGLPVFAGFTGGTAAIFSRTGGFIISFPLMALTAGIGAKEIKANAALNTVWLSLWLTIGAAINYLFGMIVFSIVAEVSLIASFGFVVVPFIPTAILKIIMVIILGKLIIKALKMQKRSA